MVVFVVLGGEVLVVVDHDELRHRQAPQGKVMGTGQVLPQFVRSHRRDRRRS